MNELVYLFMSSGVDLRVAMSGVYDRDPRKAVDVFPTCLVNYCGAEGSLDRNWANRLDDARRYVFVVLLDNLVHKSPMQVRPKTGASGQTVTVGDQMQRSIDRS